MEGTPFRLVGTNRVVLSRRAANGTFPSSLLHPPGIPEFPPMQIASSPGIPGSTHPFLVSATHPNHSRPSNQSTSPFDAHLASLLIPSRVPQPLARVVFCTKTSLRGRRHTCPMYFLSFSRTRGTQDSGSLSSCSWAAGIKHTLYPAVGHDGSRTRRTEPASQPAFWPPVFNGLIYTCIHDTDSSSSLRAVAPLVNTPVPCSP